MRNSIPTIPFELHPREYPENWVERTAQLWEEICDELVDERFEGLSHYKRHTYEAGCRGPLCCKFTRDASRSRPRSSKSYPPRPDRVYDPVIDYFRIVALKMLDEHIRQVHAALKGA